MSKKYGKELSLILKEASDNLWEIDARDKQLPYEFDELAINYAVKIFMSVCMDRLWIVMDEQDIPLVKRIELVELMGSEMRDFVLKHINVDLHESIKKEFK